MRAPEEILGISVAPSVEEVRGAYRALARRWHPDRFAPGPEREWASERMAEINMAYQTMLKKARKNGLEGDALLDRARELIAQNLLSDARELLMSASTRCARWNYLFGTLLLKLSYRDKALMYLSVAAHQEPECREYAEAYRAALGEPRPLRRRIFHR